MLFSSFDAEVGRISTRLQALFADPAAQLQVAPEELRTAVLAYPSRGGKALRPAMLAWACRALGGNEDAALHAGLAVELYHTYTLVHDDVIDRDALRRGQPSVHALLTKVGVETFGLKQDAAQYGLSMAILAGDFLHSWALHLLTTLPRLHGVSPNLALRLVRRLAGSVGPAIVEGEVRDIQLPFVPVAQVSPNDMERVLLTKTAALFAFCGWAGGLLARNSEVEDEDVRALAGYAERAGQAFQLQDDVLGITGDEATLGKPVGGDLREGKRTMLLHLGWERADDVGRALLGRVLGNPVATLADIAAASQLLVSLGAVAETQAYAERLRDEALSRLDLLPVNPAVDLLRELALRMVKRER